MFTGQPTLHGSRVRLSISVSTVPVATMAAEATRQAAHYLGVQDSIPGRSVPVASQENYIR